jgi:hypothetical protein
VLSHCNIKLASPMATTEAWLRGPVDGVPALLQPVAHALLQAREETRALLRDFPVDLLWNRPAGLASVGFHLQHLSGVVDRLFTYARGEPCPASNATRLKARGRPPHQEAVSMICSTLLTRRWTMH